MHFSRFISFAAAVFTGASLVVASPVESTDVLVKRQSSPEAELLAILEQLDADVTPHVTGIDSLVSSGSVSQSAIEPRMLGIASAFDKATASVKAIQPAALARMMVKRTDPTTTSSSVYPTPTPPTHPPPPTHDEIALCLCKIIEKVIKVIYKLLLFILFIPKLLIFCGIIDKALSLLLIAIKVLLPTVIVLVAKLLFSLLFILQALLFVLTCGCLGY